MGGSPYCKQWLHIRENLREVCDFKRKTTPNIYDPTSDFGERESAYTRHMRPRIKIKKGSKQEKIVLKNRKARRKIILSNNKNGENKRIPGLYDGVVTCEKATKLDDVTKSILADEPEMALMEEVMGLNSDTGRMHSARVSQQITQINVLEESITLDVDKLISIAMTWPLSAQMKRIDVDKMVSLSGGNVGKHYAAYVAVVADLLAACNGEITLFQSAPQLYWDVRSLYTPRTLDKIRYAYATDTIPSIESLLSFGIPFQDPKDDSALLSWFTGVLSPSDRAEIETNIPTFITFDDITDFCVSSMTDLWASLRRGEQSILTSMPEIGKYSNSAAGFANPSTNSVPGFDCYVNYRIEVPIPKHMRWLLPLTLAESSSRRSHYTYASQNGPVRFNSMVWGSEIKSASLIVPKPIPFADCMLNTVQIILEADILRNDIDGNTTMQQPANSVLGQMTDYDLYTYIQAVVSKRFEVSAFFLKGNKAVQRGSVKFGIGTRWLTTSKVDSMMIPMNLVESFAGLGWFDRKGDGAWAENSAYIPYIFMNQEKSYANPYENSVSGTPTYTSAVQAMYPRATVGPWNTQTSTLPAFLDIGAAGADEAFFAGPTPSLTFENLSTVFSNIQGNVITGPSQGNEHPEECTTLYLTSVRDASIEDGWDDAATLITRRYCNRYEFNPNMITNSLMRVGAVLCLTPTQEEQYLVFSREFQGMRVDDVSAAVTSRFAQAYVHKVAGEGAEQVISDVALIEQHKGGGFVDVLRQVGSIGLPILGQIGGSILDQFLPGIGGVVGGLGQAAGNALRDGEAVRSRVLQNSGYNSMAPVLRPITGFIHR